MEKKQVGRPPKDIYEIDFMCKKIEEYCEKKNKSQTVPILKECTLLNYWNYDYVMELQRKHEKLSQSIKRLLALKEVRLESLALTGEINTTFAIFSLKQPVFGWTDKMETSNTTTINVETDPLSQALEDLANGD